MYVFNSFQKPVSCCVAYSTWSASHGFLHTLTWTQGQILDFSFLGVLASIFRANFL